MDAIAYKPDAEPSRRSDLNESNETGRGIGHAESAGAQDLGQCAEGDLAAGGDGLALQARGLRPPVQQHAGRRLSAAQSQRQGADPRRRRHRWCGNRTRSCAISPTSTAASSIRADAAARSEVERWMDWQLASLNGALSGDLQGRQEAGGRARRRAGPPTRKSLAPQLQILDERDDGRCLDRRQAP